MVIKNKEQKERLETRLIIDDIVKDPLEHGKEYNARMSQLHYDIAMGNIQTAVMFNQYKNSHFRKIFLSESLVHYKLHQHYKNIGRN